MQFASKPAPIGKFSRELRKKLHAEPIPHPAVRLAITYAGAWTPIFGDNLIRLAAVLCRVWLPGSKSAHQRARTMNVTIGRLALAATL